MSIFDRLRKDTAQAVQNRGFASSVGKQTKCFTFQALPESLDQLQALPEASLTDPFATAALTVCALCAYAADRAVGTQMLNWLKGPRPLSNQEISFLNDRFRDGTHVPFSYFKGATPDNNYTPSQPYSIVVESGPYSDANEGYKKLYLKSGGADNPREIVLRRKGDGQWLLWDQFLMVGIRPCKADDPWA